MGLWSTVPRPHTSTLAQMGLWSERTYYCRVGCDEVGPGTMTWDITLVRALAHAMDRPHCRMCRERVITGTLTERPHVAAADVAKQA